MERIADPGRANATGKPEDKAAIIVKIKIKRKNVSIMIGWQTGLY